MSIKIARKKQTPLPSKEELLKFIKEQPGHLGKRELAKAFNLKGADKIGLKALLKELESAGAIERGRKRRFAQPGTLPDVAVVEISGTDQYGELVARPVAYEGDGRPPMINLVPWRKGDPVVGVGDRVLCRLRRTRGESYEARPIRVVGEARARVLGVFESNPDGSGRLRPTSRKEKADYVVMKGETLDAKDGDLVMCDLLPGRLYGLRTLAVKEVLGQLGAPKSISLVAIHSHDIPFEFPEAVIAEADGLSAVDMDHRTDMRAIPLVTIDGEDARDFDDAVWAEPDPSPDNQGGWHCIVAIADVSWYVRPDQPLDKEAFKRGNSVYFPDRVVPMLPEALSNGWCSLRPNEDRGCLLVHFWLDKDGKKLRHKFDRALMRSAARLTYNQVQAAMDGRPDELTGPLIEPILKPLYRAWGALFAARNKRGVLDLDLPERKVDISPEGQVLGVSVRERLNSHRLIEDFMIQANVCAAEELERLRQPCMYRVHDQPSLEKLDSLREFLGSMDLSLPKGQSLRPKQLNQILEKVKGSANEILVNEVMLRSQSQACYSPDNIGHFGLALGHYAHFTSPIRRYADLLVHRALVAGLKLGAGALPANSIGEFTEWGEHISTTERRAATAEREAVERYVTAFMADRVGASFKGKISGVTRFGLFVNLIETGAEGLLPIATLPGDYYDHIENKHALVGRNSGRKFQLGQVLDVVLREADTYTGSMTFLLEENAEDIQQSHGMSRTRLAARALIRTQNGRGDGKPQKPRQGRPKSLPKASRGKAKAKKR